MSTFCPVPHTTRDQVWLGVGVGVGVGLGVLASRWLWRGGSAATRNLQGPSVLPAPTRVVEMKDQLAIDEHAGRATTGESALSLAHVRVSAACSEPTQVPGFDEYVLVLSGEMVVEVGAEEPCKRPAARRADAPFELRAGAGRTLWLPAGHRYTYRFPSKCEYVPVCVPAFHPEIAGREQ